MKQTVKIGKSTPSLKFFMTLIKAEAKISRYFEQSFGEISFKEFIVLNSLRESSERKLKRIELAKKIGLTAQGLTRILKKMEVAGLILSNPDKKDKRVNYITLTNQGIATYIKTLERAEVTSSSMLPNALANNVKSVSLFLTQVCALAEPTRLNESKQKEIF